MWRRCRPAAGGGPGLQVVVHATTTPRTSNFANLEKENAKMPVKISVSTGRLCRGSKFSGQPLARTIASASLSLANVVVEEALRTEPVGVDANSCGRTRSGFKHLHPLLTSIHKNSEMFRQVLAQP